MGEVRTINEHYSAWFVGGGTAWTYPHKAHVRSNEEGTWGMDYDGIFAPRHVWMNWSKGRKQGGLGAYETDQGTEEFWRSLNTIDSPRLPYPFAGVF